MNLSRALKRMLAAAGYRAAHALIPGVYAQDGLISVHNHDFMQDAAFGRAYARGIKALLGNEDYQWHWRVHVGLWAARCAWNISGDFVECGVNRGFMSSAIMEHLDWDRGGRTFYLLDTFAGLDERFVSGPELRRGALAKNREELVTGFYVSGAASVHANFAQWKNLRIIEGAIPDTLAQVESARIAYLHLDMNCAPPEVAAAEYFWDRLADSAIVLLDDYAYRGYEPQKSAMDEFAALKGVSICALPTGQGLMLKPPASARSGSRDSSRDKST